MSFLIFAGLHRYAQDNPRALAALLSGDLIMPLHAITTREPQLDHI